MARYNQILDEFMDGSIVVEYGNSEAASFRSYESIANGAQMIGSDVTFDVLPPSDQAISPDMINDTQLGMSDGKPAF